MLIFTKKKTESKEQTAKRLYCRDVELWACLKDCIDSGIIIHCRFSKSLELSFLPVRVIVPERLSPPMLSNPIRLAPRPDARGGPGTDIKVEFPSLRNSSSFYTASSSPRLNLRESQPVGWEAGCDVSRKCPGVWVGMCGVRVTPSLVSPSFFCLCSFEPTKVMLSWVTHGVVQTQDKRATYRAIGVCREQAELGRIFMSNQGIVRNTPQQWGIISPSQLIVQAVFSGQTPRDK
ncbi:hypothetical protein RRG08_027101 [Elysia crispata]|uniref:Uncharacterized protein n=1 Tax=Elysia crispata TaxID=231223 RepID=A0AAE0YUF0_9GAST|nr:hypothetical protein RRG08_027101 [Elysia crispata]